MSADRPESILPAAPRAALLAVAEQAVAGLEAAGRTDDARALREGVGAWCREQRDWTAALARQLSVHHDINNALVGVRGNAQLLMMGPAAQAPGVRERLEVVLRESERIREAALRLNALKGALTMVVHEGESAPASRAA